MHQPFLFPLPDSIDPKNGKNYLHWNLEIIVNNFNANNNNGKFKIIFLILHHLNILTCHSRRSFHQHLTIAPSQNNNLNFKKITNVKRLIVNF